MKLNQSEISFTDTISSPVPSRQHRSIKAYHSKNFPLILYLYRIRLTFLQHLYYNIYLYIFQLTFLGNMEKIIITLFLLSTAVLAEDTIYMRGNLTDLLIQGSGCYFKINVHSSPSLVKNLRFCHLLTQAYQANQPVSIDVTITTDGDVNNFKYAISFLDSTATWPSGSAKAEKISFKYQLAGKVSDVRYYSPSNKCYIAIETGLPVRNNNVYHYTGDYDFCDVAVGAFYTKSTVNMMGKVDLTPGYANDVVDLTLANFCKDSQ